MRNAGQAELRAASIDPRALYDAARFYASIVAVRAPDKLGMIRMEWEWAFKRGNAHTRDYAYMQDYSKVLRSLWHALGGEYEPKLVTHTHIVPPRLPRPDVCHCGLAARYVRHGHAYCGMACEREML